MVWERREWYLWVKKTLIAFLQGSMYNNVSSAFCIDCDHSDVLVVCLFMSILDYKISFGVDHFLSDYFFLGTEIYSRN